LDVVPRHSHEPRGAHHEPPGTKSTIFDVYDRGEKVAVVHAYERPDGSLGASGQYDPKAVLVGTILHIPEV